MPFLFKHPRQVKIITSGFTLARRATASRNPDRGCDIRRPGGDDTAGTFAIQHQIWYRKTVAAHLHRLPFPCLAAACFVEFPAFSLSSCAATPMRAGDDGKWTPAAVVAANERFHQLQFPG
jgi:hypothetical protein